MGGGWRKGGKGCTGPRRLGKSRGRVSGGAGRGSHCPSFFIRCSPLFAPRMKESGVWGGTRGGDAIADLERLGRIGLVRGRKREGGIDMEALSILCMY